MAKPKLLNVKKHLNRVSRTITDILLRDGKYVGGTTLSPLDREELISIRFMTDAILRRHKSKNTRKDIRLEQGE